VRASGTNPGGTIGGDKPLRVLDRNELGGKGGEKGKMRRAKSSSLAAVPFRGSATLQSPRQIKNYVRRKKKRNSKKNKKKADAKPRQTAVPPKPIHSENFYAKKS